MTRRGRPSSTSVAETIITSDTNSTENEFFDPDGEALGEMLANARQVMQADVNNSEIRVDSVDNRLDAYEQGKKSWWKRLFTKKNKTTTTKKYSVDEFFQIIKKGASTMNVEKATTYKKSIVAQIKQCQQLGQTKAMDKLNAQLIGLAKEVRIINKLGLTQYVFESDVADLENKGIEGRTIRQKNLEDYEGIIPEDKIKVIAKAKSTKLFDSIVILYTRKRERALELDKKKKTDAPVRKKVDPICFGLVKETGRWFFIADWEDDECDLTMKKLQTMVDVGDLVPTPKKKK